MPDRSGGVEEERDLLPHLEPELILKGDAADDDETNERRKEEEIHGASKTEILFKKRAQLTSAEASGMLADSGRGAHYVR